MPLVLSALVWMNRNWVFFRFGTRTFPSLLAKFMVALSVSFHCNNSCHPSPPAHLLKENGVDLFSHVGFCFEVDIIISRHVQSLSGIIYTDTFPFVTSLIMFFNKLFYSFSVFADCYDPLDPNGNITITFDTHKWTDDGYVVSVLVQAQ